MSKFVYLIRHGQTPVNNRAVLHQTADDAELTDVGKNQIATTAEWLSTRQAQIKTVYCSTERRAEQSAELLAEKLGTITTQPKKELRERNWGDWSGKTWAEVENVLEDFSLEDRYNFVPPNGESWAQFTDRLQKIWWQLVTTAGSDEDLVMVTHGGVIRALVPELLGLPLETSFMIQPTNGEVMTFELIADSAHPSTRPQIVERTDLNFIPAH
jgi:broad specificity phosphatase PhoE